jgi:hypothetical protein
MTLFESPKIHFITNVGLAQYKDKQLGPYLVHLEKILEIVALPCRRAIYSAIYPIIKPCGDAID